MNFEFSTLSRNTRATTVFKSYHIIAMSSQQFLSINLARPLVWKPADLCEQVRRTKAAATDSNSENIS